MANLLAVLALSRHPNAVLIVAFTVTLFGRASGLSQEPFVGAAWALHQVASQSRLRRPVASGLVFLAGLLILLLITRVPFGTLQLFQELTPLTLLTGSWTIGILARAQMEKRERAALASELAQPSRDLPDVLSHTPGSIAVQAGVAANVECATDSLGLALRTLKDIMTTCHSAIREVQGALSDIRSECDSHSHPTIESAHTSEERGLANANPHAVGTRAPEAPKFDMGHRQHPYRIVQEMLTNIDRHSIDGGDIVLSIRPGILRIRS